ncbi:MAG: MoaD/ThiS family protein [Promethearchaeota archaeon]
MPPIQIEFRVFANLRDILDHNTQILEIPENVSIFQFLQWLRRNLPNGEALFHEIYDIEKNCLVPYVKIIVNGHILFKHELETFILSKDLLISPNEPIIVAIFPPVGGG